MEQEKTLKYTKEEIIQIYKETKLDTTKLDSGSPCFVPCVKVDILKLFEESKRKIEVEKVLQKTQQKPDHNYGYFSRKRGQRKPNARQRYSNWWYINDSNQVETGPLSKDQMMNLYVSDKIGASTKIKCFTRGHYTSLRDMIIKGWSTFFDKNPTIEEIDSREEERFIRQIDDEYCASDKSSEIKTDSTDLLSSTSNDSEIDEIERKLDRLSAKVKSEKTGAGESTDVGSSKPYPTPDLRQATPNSRERLNQYRRASCLKSNLTNQRVSKPDVKPVTITDQQQSHTMNRGDTSNMPGLCPTVERVSLRDIVSDQKLLSETQSFWPEKESQHTIRRAQFDEFVMRKHDERKVPQAQSNPVSDTQQKTRDLFKEIIEKKRSQSKEKNKPFPQAQSSNADLGSQEANNSALQTGEEKNASGPKPQTEKNHPEIELRKEKRPKKMQREMHVWCKKSLAEMGADSQNMELLYLCMDLESPSELKSYIEKYYEEFDPAAVKDFAEQFVKQKDFYRTFKQATKAKKTKSAKAKPVKQNSPVRK